MELGLSLGDASKPFNFLKNNPLKQQKNTRMKNGGLDFCMALGLNSIENEEREKTQKPLEDEDEDDDDDDVDDEVSEEDGSEENPLQLNLLPFPPRISHHLHSFPWSSDNGSSENGSSAAAAKGRGAAAEEASSANSEMEYLCSGSKREMRNDVVEEEDDIDDDDNGVNNSNRKKLRLSKQQSAFLEQTFKLHNTLNPKQKLGLAKQLNLRPRQVEVWFQNRRARTKSKQTEVDCEYLKRCCETLTEENRRLRKELQDLRALKTSNPFYMQLPATTLTMCPSCQRVATATTAAAVPAAVPFPLNRPRFFPFLQTPTHHHQPAAT